ncbi:hypothetical protein TEA_018790 [Camellia sinensis var. sinensis]|uniref:Cellulose synthase-like protein G3 n=1 Tax=Camellia sinensis var. sinensis TaxID=542762 RepID=A0A4V3WN68_CAMSN|nr:hypothetical protein TEA_018790 [Camellia sinensis var. sinensis]
MTNAPIILTLDCDMYSNDPQTPHRALCFFSDLKLRPNLGYVQFPQIFHGLNKDDIYACEFKRLFQINPVGMDGLQGPSYVGTGCFFSRRVFSGGPSSFLAPEIPELRPDHVVSKPIQAQQVLALAHRVADCKYENQTNWGSNVRVSAIMTNAPIILTLDCDMYSNDPQTPHRALCFFSDLKLRPNLGYVQFPQIFHGLNKDDIYACEFKRLFQINPVGMDGLQGPSYVGTGCFFSRRVFFGGPSSFLAPEIPELRPDHAVSKPIQAQQVLALAHQVADCKYENQTNWGSNLGFRYGSLVEDYYTGYRLQCEGWKSVFCHPNRAAFLGDVPINLNDVLSQTKRWCVGLLEVGFSKHSPVTFGSKAMGPLMGLCYAHYAFWPIWSIPITIYAFLPQLTLLNGISIFPKVSDIWFFLYIFLFIGSYGQDCLDYILAKGTFQRWWSDQRMWLVRGVTSYMFGLIEFISKYLGIATQGFNVTSKVVDNEQGKRYNQGTFEFGVESPMFMSLAVAAIINLTAFVGGLIGVLRGKNSEGLFGQLLITGFVVLNCCPVYEAMVLRTDKGRMPTKTTIISTFLAWALYTTASLILKI